MTRTTIKTSFILICMYMFILLFVYAAVSKLLDFETFETQLGQSPLLSAYAQWVALIVPVSEIVIAGLLCYPVFRNIGLYGFYTMMVMFTAYIVIILNFTSFTPCSCGGVLEDLGWTEHLIFNVAFIALSGLVLLYNAANKRKTLIKLGLLAILSSSVITAIFLSSEKQIKRNNAFVRRYMPHALEKIGSFDLKSTTYYIAGLDNDFAYLGNFNAPLLVKRVNKSLNEFEDVFVKIDSVHLPYRKVKISVKSPYFYLGDGTIPILFRGKINNWQASLFSYKDAFFTDFKVVDSLNIGITTRSSSTNTNALGLFKKTSDSICFELYNDIIISQSKGGTFDSEGTLLWNDKQRRFVYTYFYRNNYDVTDENLRLIHKGNTIDTVSNAIVDVALYSKKQAYKLGGNSVIINKQSATSEHFLFIHSDRLGRYEEDQVLGSASIIDVYNIKDFNYAFSFYLYHQRGGTLGEFSVYGNTLIALVDNEMILYRLNSNYFKN